MTEGTDLVTISDETPAVEIGGELVPIAPASASSRPTATPTRARVSTC